MNREPIPLYRPALVDTARDALMRCYDSGWWGYGPVCRRIEARFTAADGGWSLATSSCTSALYIAGRLIHEAERNEIIVPAVTWVSSAIAFIQAGFSVKVADVCPDTLLIDPDSVSSLISSRTRGLVAVHLYGQQCDLKPLRAVCDRYGLVLIEDCAHNLNGNRSISDFACYSFNVLKEAPGGEGGLLWGRELRHEEIANQISGLGMQSETIDRTGSLRHEALAFSAVPGLKLKMMDLAASVVEVMLDYVEVLRAKRSSIFERYTKGLKAVRPFIEPLNRRESHEKDSLLMYVIRSEYSATLRDILSGRGISTGHHYPSLSAHPLVTKSSTPVADRAAENLVTLPCFFELKEPEQDRVINEIKSAICSLRKQD